MGNLMIVVGTLPIVCAPNVLNCSQKRKLSFKTNCGKSLLYSKKLRHLLCNSLKAHPMHNCTCTRTHLHMPHTCQHHHSQFCILSKLTGLVYTDVCHRIEDPGTLDVENGVPRAAPALLRRVVLSQASANLKLHSFYAGLPVPMHHSTTKWMSTLL